MDCSEAFGETVSYTPGKQVTINGHLVVTPSFSYMVEPGEDGLKSRRAIFVAWPELSEALIDAGAPMLVGSMVLFSGEAELSGRLYRSGMELLPVALGEIASVSLRHEDELFVVKRNAT